MRERRKQVVRLKREGIGVMRIVALSGLSYSTVRGILDRYEQDGAETIKLAPRGRQGGESRLLTDEQERLVGQIKPWLEEEYPALEKRAKAAGAEIHWGAETAVVNPDVRGRRYAPAGKTPVTLAVGGARQKLAMIATITNQGKTRWMIIDEAFNADKLIEFLEAFIKDAAKQVFLILDNLRGHHNKPVKAWVDGHNDKIELFYLPSYRPELNPEERLNAELKQAIYTKVPVRTKAKLTAATTEHLRILEKSPERVKKYFQDSRVKYAA